MRVRIIKNWEHADGYLFWRGNEFNVVGRSGADGASGDVEVKVMGEYVWIPADIVQVIEES